MNLAEEKNPLVILEFCRTTLEGAIRDVGKAGGLSPTHDVVAKGFLEVFETFAKSLLATCAEVRTQLAAQRPEN